MDKRGFLKAMSAGGASLLVGGCGRAAGGGEAGALPREIRIVGHGAWGAKRPNGVMGILQTHGYLDQEFEKDGVHIDFKPMDGGGININEAIAGRLVDASSFGAFPQIVGRARGLKTKVLASQGYHYNYFAVRSGFAARTPAELGGATLAVSFGSYSHHSTALLLHEHGLSLKDVKLVNMDAKDSLAALAAGRIDGFLGQPTVFALEEQGLARIIYTTKGRATHASAFGGLFVTEDFWTRYPEATRRIVRGYLRAVHWVSQPENRQAFFKFNQENSTTPLKYLERDFAGRELKEAHNPVVDDYFVERYRETVQFCLENKIIRNPIDVDAWIDRKTIASVLAELGLENYWSAWDASGKPVAGSART